MKIDSRVLQDRVAFQKLSEDQSILLRSVGKLAKIGFFIWDELEDKPIHVSQEVAGIHGLTVDEYFSRFNSSGKIAADMIGDDRQRYLETRARCRVTGASYTIDFSIRARDGT